MNKRLENIIGCKIRAINDIDIPKGSEGTVIAGGECARVLVKWYKIKNDRFLNAKTVQGRENLEIISHSDPNIAFVYRHLN